MTVAPAFILLLTSSVTAEYRMVPAVIEAGAFYSGANVKIEGEAAAGSQMMVAITGAESSEAFDRKTRFGPVWISGGRVRVSGMPSVFLRFATGPAALLDRGSMARHQLDEAALMARMQVTPASPGDRDDAAIRAGYMALKKDDRVYRFGDSGITTGAPRSDRVPFSLQFHWPKKAPPGTYAVRIFEIRDGAVIREASLSLPVVRIGFPAWLAGLAHTRAPLYGIAAVLVAVMAGFGIDLLTTRVFGKKGRPRTDREVD